MNTLILPYNSASESGKALSNALGIKRAVLDKTTPNRVERTIINWGNSGEELGSGVLSNVVRVINPPSRVTVAINKLSCLETLSGANVSIPEFTTDRDKAKEWVENGKEVVARSLLRASGGRGISFVTSLLDLASVPLYTRYVKKKDEYRIHVAGGVVFDVQKKAKRQGANPSTNGWKLRNLENGFIYKRNNVQPPESAMTEAIKAVQALGLDFGAVDIIYNAHYDKSYVLEVNTACGLEGSTVDKYATAIQCLLRGEAVPQWEMVTDEPEEEGIPTATPASPPPFPNVFAQRPVAIMDDHEEEEEDEYWDEEDEDEEYR